MKVSLLTITSDRRKAFSFCKEYVSRFDIDEEVEWIVVDDGEESIQDLAENSLYIRRTPCISPVESFRQNLLTGLEAVSGDVLFFIEDDDWYHPNFVKRSVEKLQTFSAVGECRSRYYNVKDRRYRIFPNTSHASLCQTAVVSEEINTFKEMFHSYKGVYFDLHFWQSQTNGFLFPETSHSIGIKGLPGKTGFSRGHVNTVRGYIRDDSGIILTAWVGKDSEEYKNFLSRKPQKLERSPSKRRKQFAPAQKVTKKTKVFLKRDKK